MKSRRAGRSAIVLALVAAATFGMAPPSHGQVLDACRAEPKGPTFTLGGHEVTGTGSYVCSRRQQVVTVFVCLGPVGGLPECNGDTQEDAMSASAYVSFPCVPGLWVLHVVGTSSSSVGAARSTFSFIPRCDPFN